jgi:hypothetical protein
MSYMPNIPWGKYLVDPFFGKKTYSQSASGPSPQYTRTGGMFGKGGVGSRVSGKITPFIPSGPYGYPTTGKQLVGKGLMEVLNTYATGKKLNVYGKGLKRQRRLLTNEIQTVLPYELAKVGESFGSRGMAGGTLHRREEGQLTAEANRRLIAQRDQEKQFRDLKKWSWLFS